MRPACEVKEGEDEGERGNTRRETKSMKWKRIKVENEIQLQEA